MFIKKNIFYQQTIKDKKRGITQKLRYVFKIKYFLCLTTIFFQVYGITGLRVIDTSIMPRVTTGNTHAPAVMIAEKGSDMIKARWLTPESGFFYTNAPNQRIDRQWRSL